MTRMENAIKAAEQLPEELQEKLGEDLLRFIDKYMSLRDDLEQRSLRSMPGRGSPRKRYLPN